MKSLMKKLEDFLEIGGTKKDITFLVISGIALICSIFKLVPTKIDIALVEDKVEELLHSLYMLKMLRNNFLTHIGKSLNCFCKIFNRLICISMFNSVFDAVFDMSF